MPSRTAVARELAEVFKLLAHPDRIRLVEELRSGENDVNTLATELDLPGPRVSQHLSLLRAHRVVTERRAGRHHYYTLVRPGLAQWIVAGLTFLEGGATPIEDTKIAEVRKHWSGAPADS